MQYLVGRCWAIVLFLFVVIGCSSGNRDGRHNLPIVQTSLHLTIPFTIGGHLVVQGESGERWETSLDELGQAKALLGNASGHLTVTMGSDVLFVEPRSGVTVTMGTVGLQFPVLDVEAGATVFVVLDPWQPIAWAASGGDLTGYAHWLALLDGLIAGCAADVDTVVGRAPYASEDRATTHRTLTAESLNYMCWGGLSVVAARLASAAGLPEHERITTPVLIAAIARAAADGDIAEGDLISLIDGVSLPTNILREPLAQGIRSFADSAANTTAIGSGTILDVLACLAASTTEHLGPAGSGLDTTGPDVTVKLPPSGATIAALSSFLCTADDAAGVADIGASALRDGTSYPEALQNVAVSGLGTPHATLTLDVATNGIADGLLDLQCQANDSWGNQGTDTRQTTLNSSAGDVEVEGLDALIVDGTVEFSCVCSDLQATSCALVGEMADSDSITVVSQAPQETVYEWDTTSLRDGEYILVCESTSTGLPAVQDAARVHTDNLKAITYAGDVPFSEGTIYARRFDGVVRDVLAQAPIEDGAFVLPVDADAGLLVLVASPGPLATHIRLTSSEEASFTGPLWRYQEHTPSHDAFVVSDVHLHAATTAAVATCAGLHALRGGDFEATCSDAHAMWSMYLNPGSATPSDPRDLPLVSLLDEDAASYSEAVIRLSMWHSGLEYLGGLLAQEAGSRPTALGWPRMLSYLLDDLSDGVLNSLTVLGDTIDITDSYSLRTNTCRIDIASAAVLWIRVAAYDEDGNIAVPVLDLEAWRSFLALIAEHDSALFGRDVPEALDLSPPQLSLPAEHPETASGTTRICIAVDDTDPEVEGWFAVPDGKESLANVSLDTGRLCGDLDTTQYGDGPSVLVATAVVIDSLGNRSELQVTISRISNSGPTIELLAPEDPDSSLTGGVAFRWKITDPTGLTQVRVLPESLGVVQEVESTVFQLVVDTLDHPDGVFEFDIVATNDAGKATPLRNRFLVDNVDPGLLSGCVFVDSPVESASVNACAVDLASRSCAYVATGQTDSDGCFQIAIPDSIQETWLELSTVNGHYISSTTGLLVSMEAFEGLYGMVRYAPSRPGTELNSVSVNAYTSLAAKWAQAHPVFDGDTIRTSARLLGEHLGRNGYVDISRVFARDLVGDTRHAEERSDASSRLALAHVGLAWCGNAIAEASQGSPSGMSTIHLLELFYEDAPNGLFEGLNADGARIRAMSQNLDSHTLRWELATCISAYLQSDANTSELTTSNMNSFLVGVAENPETRLFGDTPPRRFDQDPPIVTSLTVKDALGEPVDLSRPVRATIAFTLTAEDPSAFSDPPVVVSGIDSLTLVSMTPNSATVLTATYTLDTTTLVDGREYTAHFEVTDELGNTAPVDKDITADNTKPVISIVAPTLGNSLSFTVEWSVEEDIGPLARIEFQIAGQTVHTLRSISDLEGTVDLELLGCNASFSLAAFAVDEAGNVGPTVTQGVSCDNMKPTFFFYDTLYHSALDGLATRYTAEGIEYLPTGEPVAIEHEQWASVPTIHKYENRLDYLPEAGIDEGANNIPTLAFIVADHSPLDGTSVEVEYRYLLNDVVRRPWTRLVEISSSEYRLPIAYQTLLPDGATKETNFIATSVPTDEHKIEVRATDAAENTEYASFPFHLHLYSVPMYLSNCRIVDSLAALSLSDIRQLYLLAGPHHIADADLIWDRALAANSLAPDREVRIRIKDSHITSHLAETAQTKVFTNATYVVSEDAAIACSENYDEAHQLLARFFQDDHPRNATYSYDDPSNCVEDFAQEAPVRGIPELISGDMHDNVDVELVYRNVPYTPQEGAFLLTLSDGVARLELSLRDESYSPPAFAGYESEPFAWILRELQLGAIGNRELVNVFATLSGRDLEDGGLSGTYGMDWDVVTYIREFALYADDIDVEVVIPSLPVEPCETCPDEEQPNVVIEHLDSCAQEVDIITGPITEPVETTVRRVSQKWTVGEP